MFAARIGTFLALASAPDCDAGKAPATPSHPVIVVGGDEVLMDKDVVHAVGDTGITVMNRGRGMTIEAEGGHEVFATLDVAKGTEKASLDLHGWDPQTFAGHEFALTGIGEKYGGADVKVRVTKKK